MGRNYRTDRRGYKSSEAIVKFHSLESLDEDQCKIALERLQAERDGRGVQPKDFYTIIALQMRLAQFRNAIR